MIDETRSKFFWRLLLGASLVAAFVSLLTTGLGLSRYITLPLAWALAIAVQVGLFGLAWLIGIGHSVHRAWITVLYCVTMLFSVTFSYVTLQSELTERTKPAESRQRLFDLTRAGQAELSQQVEGAIKSSQELALRLESWVEMERRDGWATRTCEVDDHCYLAAVCTRIKRRIERWQQETGQTYREGPGEKLIFGTLATELETVRQLDRRLRSFRSEIAEVDVLAAEIDNRERLTRFDRLLARAPLDDLAAVRCEEAVLPEVPSYLDHARDQAQHDEQPIYAWTDLIQALDGEGPRTRGDFPTLFALALALFIDLFVLAVALGASVIAGRDGAAQALVRLEAPASWETALERDIESWVDASLLAERRDPAVREAFLQSVLEAIRFDDRGAARLLPEDDRHKRFGHLLVQAQAAKVQNFIKYNRIGRLFVLEPWVYPALTRHFVLSGAPAG